MHPKKCLESKNKIVFFSNLLENEAITHWKTCVVQELTHNLLVPCVYISNKQRQWTLTWLMVKTVRKDGVTKMSPVRIFFIPCFVNCFSYLTELLIENESISVGHKCWHGRDRKWWRYFHRKCHFGANNRYDKNVPQDDVMKWKHFPRYWPFVRGIHRSPVNSPHKGQWRGALIFSLICAWINGWVNKHEAGGLRRLRTHYDVTVMLPRIRSVNRGATLVLPCTSCYGTNCLQEEYDQCLNIANVAT